MRKVFWQMMVSLDGFMEGPNRELDWHVVDEDFARYVADMGSSIDTMLFGRVTYQLMADYWPTSTDPEARMMNELPRIVFFEDAGESRMEKLEAGQSEYRGRGLEIETAARQGSGDIRQCRPCIDFHAAWLDR